MDNLNEKLDIALKLYEDRAYRQAFLKYEELAKLGSVESQVFVGWLYQQGLGVELDESKSIDYYKKAAQKNYPEANYRLARVYSTRKAYDMAQHHYTLAANQNYSPALYRLGRIYQNGINVDPNQAIALEFYKKASDRGHIFGMKSYSLLLIKGSYGFVNKIRGILLFLKTFYIAIYFGIKDPHSDKLQD